MRDILRSSQLKSSTDSERSDVHAPSDVELHQLVSELRAQLAESLSQQDKLTTELRIERNLRLELEKTNKHQQQRIEELEAATKCT